MFFQHKNNLVYAAIAFSTFLLIAFFIAFSILYHSDVNLKKNEIYIQKGDSLSDVIAYLDLDENSKFNLKFVMRVLSLYDDVKPGKHTFENVVTLRDFIKNITSSPKVKITILEGWDLENIAYYLHENSSLHSIDIDNFHQLCTNQNFISRQLSILSFEGIESLEGYLYPDTYSVDPYIDEKDLIKVFISEFLNKTEKYHDKINNNVMITASIIEAETDLIIEMDTISSVYNNRIKKSMRLEADPTVLSYMTKEDLKIFKDRSNRRARKESAEIWRKYKNMDNPYNTYKYNMPPGPINCPRIEAIEAALKPADTNYLYMVMSGRLGKHLFSKDYETHAKRVKGN